ncbi:MAG: FAD-dependent oxidoreductase [Aminobacteriaceae bacterium]
MPVIKRYPHLFSPIKIGALTARNRIESTPISMGDLTPEGYLTPGNVAAYEIKARGGAAIVNLGESNVHTKTGKAHGRMIPLDDDEILPSLINTTDAIRRHGALASIELLHPGRRANPRYYEGETYGPSGGPGVFGKPVIELTEEIIEEIVDAFGDSAEMARLGGMDMCMVHAAHGWLVHQFLSPLNNQRTDRFGGSLENRARFALMIVDNIRKKCGSDFPVEFRISGSEMTPGGFTIEDMVEFARMVDGKIDLLNVSEGTFHVPSTTTTMVPSMFLEQGCNVYLAEAIKKAVKTTKVSALGGIADPDLMEEIIASGRADMVAVGRALIADPDLPRKALAGRADDITPCQRCIVCMSGSFVPYVKYATRVGKCTVNPVIGKELEAFFPPISEGKKRVLIAGGGPGGMQAAITAADRGHDVLLCESSGTLGGTIQFSDKVWFKKPLKKFMDVLVRRVQERAIRVLLNTPVTPEFAREYAPDALIVAVGAEAVVPNIPGVNLPNVVRALDLYNDGTTVGKRVVFVGGGLVGCEEGLELATKGHDVTVLEMRENVAIDAAYLHREALLLEIAKHLEKIALLTDMRCKEIVPEGVIAIDKEGVERLFQADTVVVAAGMRSRSDVVDSLRGCAPDVQIIGDARRPLRVLEAVRAGYDAGMHL